MTKRIIVLTGATRGLGRALVPHFVAAGHTVIGCGRSREAIRELAESCSEPHRFSELDVCDQSLVYHWSTETIHRFGPPDLLINNAAVMNHPAPLWDISSGEFDRIIDVNVKGVANVIRTFVPHMVARKQGVIVNLSSGWGRSTSAGVAPYCASKYAIEGLTLALAQDLPPGMAAVPLNPGVIDTDMLRQCWADGTSAYPSADEWAIKAAPYILGLGPKHNGKSLTVA
jgi:NAD(P)-dependent dehydrogenase (short-subunit alcohol dehydrogenase family)